MARYCTEYQIRQKKKQQDTLYPKTVKIFFPLGEEISSESMCFMAKLVLIDSAPMQIQSMHCDVRGCVCLFVPLAGTRNSVDWRVLVKEHIAKITTTIALCTFFGGGDVFCIIFYLGFSG